MISGLSARRAERSGAGFMTGAKVFTLVAAICLYGMEAMSADGLITLLSSYAPKETMNRLETEVKAKGLTVFARIDHAAGATEVGLSLLPTELLIFGNAKGGTPLMKSVQTIGIDLPLKALVWQDASGNTWLSYNGPHWLARRHGLGHEVDAAVSVMANALDVIAKTATAPQSDAWSQVTYPNLVRPREPTPGERGNRLIRTTS
jgi:uncharacterized protein (DUF302 family)